MSNLELDLQAAGPKEPVIKSSQMPRLNLRELSYGLVLILTLFGVAYTSYFKQPILGYWALLAPAIAVICIGAGWQRADNKNARFQLIWTQALHWLAFLVVMGLMLLPSVQRILNVSAGGLAILTLLALGTFTAGVQVLSWQVCLLGLVMALGVPAIAWVEESALLFVLIVGTTLGIAVLAWRHWHERHTDNADHPVAGDS